MTSEVDVPAPLTVMRDGYGVAEPESGAVIGPVLHHMPVAGSIVVGVSTICSTVPVLVRNPEVPLNVALIRWVPSASAVVLEEAWPER